MHKYLSNLMSGIALTGDMAEDSQKILLQYDLQEIAEHTLRVTEEAKALARRFGIDEYAAETAGLLHDISRIIPPDESCKASEILGIGVLSEEAECPFILHQKLSSVMADDIFGVSDKAILNAIACHTTLRGNASDLDMVLLVADKLQWKKEDAPFLKLIREGLDISIRHGAYAFIKYSMDNKANLKVIHPWLVDAYNDLSVSCALHSRE